MVPYILHRSNLRICVLLFRLADESCQIEPLHGTTFVGDNEVKVLGSLIVVEWWEELFIMRSVIFIGWGKNAFFRIAIFCLSLICWSCLVEDGCVLFNLSVESSTVDRLSIPVDVVLAISTGSQRFLLIRKVFHILSELSFRSAVWIVAGIWPAFYSHTGDMSIDPLVVYVVDVDEATEAKPT